MREYCVLCVAQDVRQFIILIEAVKLSINKRRKSVSGWVEGLAIRVHDKFLSWMLNTRERNNPRAVYAMPCARFFKSADMFRTKQRVFRFGQRQKARHAAKRVRFKGV